MRRSVLSFAVRCGCRDARQKIFNLRGTLGQTVKEFHIWLNARLHLLAGSALPRLAFKHQLLLSALLKFLRQMRCTGSADRNVARSGSSGSNEFAIRATASSAS